MTQKEPNREAQPDDTKARIDELAEQMLERVRAAGHPAVGGEWISAEAAAVAIAETTRTLRFWRTDGGGPRFYRLGSRLVLYSLHDLAEYRLSDSLALSASDIRAPRRYVTSRR